jgi:chromate transport protein ChrA
MFCFSLGVSRIGDKLPGAVYALLSGLNAATVGIIARAAVQLSQKVITDKLTRALVFLGGAGGMLYTALWYFPILMAAAGIATMTWDLKIIHKLARLLNPRERQATRAAELEESRARTYASHAPRTSGASAATSSQHDEASTTGSSHLHQTRQIGIRSNTPSMHGATSTPNPSSGAPLPVERNRVILSWQRGLTLLVAFAASFLAIMLIRGLYRSPARTFSLFANLYLAGTIIFGGGPVVIPLLREYVVAEGWVSPRNFLLGLALIQAFPGPNFNFAVYLGALAVSGTNNAPLFGASVAFLGIFIPGLVVQSGFMGLWGSLRKNRALLSALRGVNAAAVGLVFTAVYRLWQIGYLDQNNQDGQPLGGSPWWVVVTATSFVGGTWFGLNPPGAVVLGGVMGMVWYGIVQG